MGKQYPNYTEILLPDIIAEAWATLSKVQSKEKGGQMGKQHPNYTEIILPNIIAEAWATLSKVQCKKRKVKWVSSTTTQFVYLFEFLFYFLC